MPRWRPSQRTGSVFLGALLITLALFGCDAAAEAELVDATDVPGGGGDLDGPTTPEIRVLDEPDRPLTPQGLEGAWAQRTVQAAVTDLPVLGQTATRTTTTFLLQAQLEDGGLTLSTTTCALEIDNGTELVRTLVPQALVDSLPVADRHATVAELEGVWVYEQASYTEVRGATLLDPVGDALPTTAEDPRVNDQDGDDKPGVTLVVTGLVDGEVYVVQRGTSALSGHATNANTIEGLVTWTAEQVTLGTDNPSLGTERPSRPDSPEKSTFRMVRVVDGCTCEDVLSAGEALFAP